MIRAVKGFETTKQAGVTTAAPLSTGEEAAVVRESTLGDLKSRSTSSSSSSKEGEKGIKSSTKNKVIKTNQGNTLSATVVNPSGWDDSPVRGTSFEHYCSLGTLSVEELKFCYDTDSFKKDILKLLDFGADENRICKIEACSRGYLRMNE